MLEGALRGDPDPRRRIVNEFDLRERRVHGPHLVVPHRRRLPERRHRRPDRPRPAPLRPHRARRLPGSRRAAEEDLPHRPAPRRHRRLPREAARPRPARDRATRTAISLPGASRRVRSRRSVLVPTPVRGEPGGARRRAAADRERQQLSGQRRPLDRARPARRHRAHRRPRPGASLAQPRPPTRDSCQRGLRARDRGAGVYSTPGGSAGRAASSSRCWAPGLNRCLGLSGHSKGSSCGSSAQRRAGALSDSARAMAESD